MISKIEILLVLVTILSFGSSGFVHRNKRDSGGGIETILESQLNSFPAESFALDYQFNQHVDRANKISKYHSLDKSESEAVYERSQDDSNKGVVVLSQEEDKLPFRKTKRVYVVLKKSQNAQNYYAELALLRDATARDKNPVSINGTNRVVEWIYYDEHVIHGKSPLTLITLTCVSSILVPCFFNESALTPREKFVTSPRFVAKQSPKNLIEEVESSKFKTADGSDSDENYDLYADLQINSKVQGRGVVGDILGNGLIPGVLSGASGLICGVLMIIGVCGKKAGTDTTIINESGRDLTPEEIQAAMYSTGRKKRELPGDPDLDKVLDYPGWKTQFTNPTSKDITFQHENEIFFGFGNCPFVQVKPVDLINAKSQDEVVNYYTTVLRADCVLATKLILEGLLKDGLIKLNDKTFELVSDHKYLTQPKLSLKELLGLSTATELSAFSTVYSQEARSGSAEVKKVTAPDGKKEISRSIHFIVQVGLAYLKITREKTQNHILHLTRNLIQNVNSVFGKLAQDNQNLDKCAECGRDKEVNLNDRLYVMALSQFIKRGLGPVERGTDVFASFEAFYKANEAGILKFVNVYS